MKLLLTKLAAVALSLVHTASAADWPQWRGPDGQGNVPPGPLPLRWSETENVTWKTAIPGRGWSSPVIEGNQIWLTTAIETPASPEETARRLKANTGDQPVTVLESVSLRAVCVDRATGRILHHIELLSERDPQWVHKLNSYASPTPVIENGRLYCHFGTFGNACVDTASGIIKWTNTSNRIMHENGPGSSPMLWKNLFIVQYDGSDRQFIVALDKHTGKSAWKTDRTGEMHSNPQLRKSYGTPLVTDIDGKPLLLSNGADWLYAYDPTDGSELWKIKYPNLGFSISPRPVLGHGMLYMSTSFMRAEMLAYELGDSSPPKLAWRYSKGAPQMPSPLLVGDELYFITDAGGVVTCLDAKTGAEHWRERLGGNYSASPIHANGRLYFLSREGSVSVVATGKAFKVLAKNELESGFMASPAAADGALFLRTDQALYRIEDKAD